jgi:hypothetical protein
LCIPHGDGEQRQDAERSQSFAEVEIVHRWSPEIPVMLGALAVSHGNVKSK